MASIIIGKDTLIDYNLDGDIRRFVLNGTVLFDNEKPLPYNDWEKSLIDLIYRRGLNDRSEMKMGDGKFHGFNAFIYKLFEKEKIYLVDKRGGKKVYLKDCPNYFKD